MTVYQYKQIVWGITHLEKDRITELGRHNVCDVIRDAFHDSKNFPGMNRFLKDCGIDAEKVAQERREKQQADLYAMAAKAEEIANKAEAFMTPSMDEVLGLINDPEDDKQAVTTDATDAWMDWV